ncbi:MAG: tetratricopeptide repeat protein [Fibrobacterota bacterium]
MFNTDVFAKNSDRVSLDSSDFILHETKVWIPFETTLLGKETAVNAWKSAAREFHEAVSRGDRISIIGTHHSWERYEPLGGPDAADWAGSVDERALNAKMAVEMERLRKDYAQEEERLTSILKNGTAAGKNNREAVSFRLAKIMADAGQWKEAEALLNAEIKGQPDNAKAMNNLANCYCLQGAPGKAVEYYTRASGLAPGEAALFINLALCHYLQKDPEAAVYWLKKGKGLLTNGRTLSSVLGMEVKEGDSLLLGDEKNAKEMKRRTVTRKEIKSFMIKALTNVPEKPVKRVITENALPVGADPSEIKRISDLLTWM